MVTVGIVLRVVAKPGKEEEVAAFLKGALPLAQAEPATTVWFALRFGPREFGIFDAFPDAAGRQAHLSGPIAAALMAKASELLSEPPSISQVDIMSSKGA
jgi:quinol monooxygenase YgiN